MKKALILISILLLTGCGEKINTCNIKTSELEQNWKYTSKKEKVEEIELDITYDNSMFDNIDSFEELNKAQKEVLKKEILTKLGFEKDTYEGFNIDITVEKQIKVKVKANYNKASKDLLEKIGIDTSNKNIKDIINDMKSNGANCK